MSILKHLYLKNSVEWDNCSECGRKPNDPLFVHLQNAVRQPLNNAVVLPSRNAACNPDTPFFVYALEFGGAEGHCSLMDSVVNCEEVIGKTVGRRRFPNPLQIRASDIEASEMWRTYGFRPSIRKGVYRFHSHEEADQWLMDHLTGKQEN